MTSDPSGAARGTREPAEGRPDAVATTYLPAAWVLRRVLLVRVLLAALGIGMGLVLVAILNGTDMLTLGVALGGASAACGIGLAALLGRFSGRLRLVVSPAGVEYDAGTYRIAAPW